MSADAHFQGACEGIVYNPVRDGGGGGMAPFDGSRIRAGANADPEFQLCARFWNGRVRLEAGMECYEFEMRDGRMISFEPVVAGEGRGRCAVRISGPAEEWEELLAPVPRPFWQDIMAASFRQGFTIEGDAVEYAPYYPALRRLVEVMRAVRQGG